MANIKEYNAGALGLQIPETGIEATAQAARRAGAFYNQAGEAISNVGQRLGSSIKDLGDAAASYITHNQKSAGAATFSLGLDGKDKEWNDILKDPKTDANDPSVANNFRSNSLEPFFQDWKKGFSTQEGQDWAEARIEAAREHFFKKTASDQGRLSGAEAINNLTSVAYRGANAAFEDSSSLDLHLGLLNAAINNTSPTMTFEEHQKLLGPFKRQATEHMVESAFKGEVFRDPKNGDAIAERYSRKYGEFFKPADSAAHVQFAQSQLRRAEADERSNQIMKRRADQDEARSAAWGIIQSWYDPATGALKMPKDALAKAFKNPVFEKDPEALSIVRANHAALIDRREPAVDEPGLYNSYLERMKLPDTDPRYPHVLEPQKDFGNGRLTRASANQLSTIMAKPDRNDLHSMATLVQMAHKTIEATYPQNSPFGITKGDVNNIRAQAEAKAYVGVELTRRMAKGEHWEDLLDPRSPKYLLTPEILENFRKNDTSTGTLNNEQLEEQSRATLGRPTIPVPPITQKRTPLPHTPRRGEPEPEKPAPTPEKKGVDAFGGGGGMPIIEPSKAKPVQFPPAQDFSVGAPTFDPRTGQMYIAPFDFRFGEEMGKRRSLDQLYGPRGGAP